MTLTSVVIYLAVIGLVLARRFKGQAVTTPKKLFLLPVIVAIIGLEDLSHGHAKMRPVDIAVIVIGAVLSLGLGALRGRMNHVSMRDGAPSANWTVRSLVVFIATLAIKLALDAVGVAAGGTFAVLSSSLVFTLGLTLLGEAAVVWLRAQAIAPRSSIPGRNGFSGGNGFSGRDRLSGGNGFSGGSGLSGRDRTARRNGR
jgi:uncharacterized membrane protein YgcG